MNNFTTSSKIALIGSVKSSAMVLKKLKEFNYTNVKVWGFNPSSKENVSGWFNLSKLSNELNYSYESFINIKDINKSIKNFSPELIFAVGISQIIPESIISLAKYGCIGFHPTKLPEGRGRAPIAWLILNKSFEGASTFFKMTKMVDDGPILCQEIFKIDMDDDAFSLESKILIAENKALNKLLKDPKNLIRSGIPQNERHATWFGKRAPEDGLIQWHSNHKNIEDLIKATSKPHPGAFTFFEEHKIKIWKAKAIDLPIKGVEGRILNVNKGDSFVVQCGEGLIEIKLWSSPNWRPITGMLLGYNVQNEIFKLKLQIKELLEKVKSS